MKDMTLIRTREMVTVCFMFAVLFLLAPSVRAQTGLGTVTGTVRDSQKAVIKDANVTLTNTATNSTRKTTTNEEGWYVFSSVPLGPYVIFEIGRAHV